MSPNRPEASKADAIQLLLHLFGDVADTMDLLAPEGWEQSPLYCLCHPTLEQVYRETIDLHNNINQLLKKKEPAPTLEEVAAEEHTERPCFPRDELLQLLGECAWNIFSNNHSVAGPGGEEYKLGSFRGSGRFIAEFINQHYPSERTSYDYIDFYCAGWFHHRRADLTQVYALLFGRLREQGCNWVYSFPRIQVIDLEQKQESEPKNPESYNPEKAMQEELEREERKKQSDKLRRRLDEAYEEAREKAKFEPPPEIVAAYRQVYGRWPEGWEE